MLHPLHFANGRRLCRGKPCLHVIAHEPVVSDLRAAEAPPGAYQLPLPGIAHHCLQAVLTLPMRLVTLVGVTLGYIVARSKSGVEWPRSPEKPVISRYDLS